MDTSNRDWNAQFQLLIQNKAITEMLDSFIIESYMAGKTFHKSVIYSKICASIHSKVKNDEILANVFSFSFDESYHAYSTVNVLGLAKWYHNGGPQVKNRRKRVQ